MEVKSNKLQAKDLINVGIFTAIYFVIFFAGMMLGYIPIFIPLLGLVCPILVAVYDDVRNLRSGTMQCVRYARENDVPVVLIHPDTANITYPM